MGDFFMNILITGTSSGIAYDLFKMLSKNKSNNIYLTTHTLKQKEVLENKLKSYNNTHCYKLDITNIDDYKILDDINIDIFIANSAICLGGSLLDLNIEKIKNIYDVNVIYNFNLISYIAKKMIKNNKGKIIVMSSIAGFLPIKFMGVYSSTKASINMLATTLNNEIKLINNNVKICIIAPGMYHTGFNDLMLNDNIEYINNNSLFYPIKNKIILKQKLLFDLLEKENTKSIIKQIIKAINDKNNKLIYSAPILQKIFSKIYRILNIL